MVGGAIGIGESEVEDGRTPRYLLAQADWGVDASLAGASFSRANASLAVRYDAMVGVDGCER